METMPEGLYIRQNGLHTVMEKVVGDVLTRRPENPLAYLALELLTEIGLPPSLKPLIEAVLQQKPDDKEAKAFVRSWAGDDELERSKRLDNTVGEASLNSTTRGLANTNKRVISARACTVCGRDDRPGEQRSKGFKCHECIGLPSNPNFVKATEDRTDIVKGRDEYGSFVLNEYTILDNVGKGAFGKVRLCAHNRSGQTYAVKFLSKNLLQRKMHSGNPNFDRDDGLRKIREEISIMKRLQHQNIIQIMGTMENDTDLMIVMEFLEGGQIYPSRFPAEPVPIQTLKKHIVGIAQGLVYLHANGVIHRDIKPDNILLDKRGNVKLADFGVSAQLDYNGSVAKACTFAGSPTFMPPEAFNMDTNIQEGPATDIWSFGVTIYCMAFGNLPPFRGSTVQEIGHSIQTVEIPISHENPLLNDLLSQMLDRNAESRISANGVLNHNLVHDVRIVKGQPVETIEVGLRWDDDEESAKVTLPSSGQKQGKEILCEFMRKSGDDFTIIHANKYEVRLIDIARDPRRKVTNSAYNPDETKKTIIQEDWSSDELDEELN